MAAEGDVLLGEEDDSDSSLLITAGPLSSDGGPNCSGAQSDFSLQAVHPSLRLTSRPTRIGRRIDDHDVPSVSGSR